MNQSDALTRMTSLCRHRRVGFHLEYDVDYGIDHREGWSVIVDGRVLVQFAETPEKALLYALDGMAERECSPETVLREVQGILEDNPCHHAVATMDPDCVLCTIRGAVATKVIE